MTDDTTDDTYRHDPRENSKKLVCTNCGLDVGVHQKHESVTVLACGCEFYDRDELRTLHDLLPEESDCKGPLANDDQELFCHPWEFVDHDAEGNDD